MQDEGYTPDVSLAEAIAAGIVIVIDPSYFEQSSTYSVHRPRCRRSHPEGDGRICVRAEGHTGPCMAPTQWPGPKELDMDKLMRQANMTAAEYAKQLRAVYEPLVEAAKAAGVSAAKVVGVSAAEAMVEDEIKAAMDLSRERQEARADSIHRSRDHKNIRPTRGR